MDDPGDVDPQLEALLRKAKLEEEDRQRKAQQRHANRANFLENYQWVRYIIYIWAFRLSFTLLAGVIPMGMGFYRGFFEKDTRINYTHELLEYSWRQLLKEDFSIFTNTTFRNQPAIIRHVPVISEESLHILLESLGSKHDVAVKVSSSPEFIYFDNDRPWTKRFSMTKGYQVVAHKDITEYTSCVHPFMRSLCSSTFEEKTEKANENNEKNQLFSSTNCTSDNSYLYVAFPYMSRWLESFAPSLSLLSSTLHSQPAQTNLWLSSPHVHAHMHYDLQDNFLLQLQGYKKVLLVSPEASPIVQPFSSLHPLWRQSALISTNLTLPYLHFAISQPMFESHLYNISEAMLWEVTMSPGDMLYIPAGFFHSVTTIDYPGVRNNIEDRNTETESPIFPSSESISINTWYPSRLNELFHRLQRIALPFQISDPKPKKLAKIVAILTVVCQIWETQNRDCFLQELAFRFHTLLLDGMIDPSVVRYTGLETCGIVDFKSSKISNADKLSKEDQFCADFDLQVAEFNVQTTRTANEIALVAERSKLPIALQTLAIVEYVEDIVITIFTPPHNENDGSVDNTISGNLEPCLLANILHNCRSQRTLKRRNRVNKKEL